MTSPTIKSKLCGHSRNWYLPSSSQRVVGVPLTFVSVIGENVSNVVRNSLAYDSRKSVARTDTVFEPVHLKP